VLFPRCSSPERGPLADVYVTSGRHVILHNGGRRVLTITLNVSDRTVNSFVEQAKQEIQSKVKHPPDTYFVPPKPRPNRASN
jgi:Cu/Ag efflux pump CusA